MTVSPPELPGPLINALQYTKMLLLFILGLGLNCSRIRGLALISVNYIPYINTKARH